MVRCDVFRFGRWALGGGSLTYIEDVGHKGQSAPNLFPPIMNLLSI